MSTDESAWKVTYYCRSCGRALTMPSARPGHMVFVGRAWCWTCDRYVTKGDADARSVRTVVLGR